MNGIPEIGMRAHDLNAHTPQALQEKCKALQIPYVQLALRKSFSEIVWTNHTFSIGLAEKIKADLGDVRISVLGSYINLLAEGEALEHELNVFRQNMLFAKFLGAGVVGTETGLSDHSEADYQKVCRAVRTLADDAEKLGVMIGIEGVKQHTIHSPQMMRRLLDDVDSPNVLTIFDPINYLSADNYTEQDQIIRDAFSLLADKMTVVHLKDYTVTDGMLRLVQIGSGDFNMKLLFDCIRAEKPYMDVLLEGSSEELFHTERQAVLTKAEII